MQSLKKIKQIILHHTQGENYSINSLKNFHVNKNGWEEIGYHYVIGNGINTIDGKIYSTRPEKFIGAHSLNQNKNSLGIALIGNFDKTIPTKKQFNSLLKLLIKLIKKYNLKIENIHGHNEFNKQKSCPGKNFDINKLREELNFI